MHYSSGNYEAFINTEESKDVDNKSAYIVGSGLAALAAAAFLIRDGRMKGDRIHVLEELALPGGSMGTIYGVANQAYVMHDGREMEPHFETSWGSFRSIPSLDYPDQSVLDKFYYENRKDPCYSKARVVGNHGQELPTDRDLPLSPKVVKEILNLVVIPKKDLQDRKINEIFDDEFFKSNFWLYWQTVSAFTPWANAVEMRCYLMRFVQHITTLKNLSSLYFTRYNQYENLIIPLISYLKKHGVKSHYNTIADNITVSRTEDEKVAIEIKMTKKGEPKAIKLISNDLVFITNGPITKSTTYGDNAHPTKQKHELKPSWQSWRNLVVQGGDFDHPEKFYEDTPAVNWVVSTTVTFINDDIVLYVEKTNKKDPHSDFIVTSGPTTVKDSNRLLGYSISRQPQFRKRKPNELTVWLHGLYSNTKGNYVKKTMPECDGIEPCEEWPYHMSVPESETKRMAVDATTIPNHMPHITSYFMPHALGDRLEIVPKNPKNLALIGDSAGVKRDTVFTTECSVRAAMEVVYTLLNIDRGVPEVSASASDVRMLMNAMYYLNDKKKLTELNLPLSKKLMVKEGLKRVKGTYVEELLKKYKLT